MFAHLNIHFSISSRGYPHHSKAIFERALLLLFKYGINYTRKDVQSCNKFSDHCRISATEIKQNAIWNEKEKKKKL